ncbi:MAG: hypothetical protein QME75_05070 [Deltaproteobacteria bacterium]|nr:hypothetical protein [Deltaproteobacteria bacterium]
MMTKTDLKRQPVSSLKRIANYMGIIVPRDFSRDDIFETICDRLGSPEENRVGWWLLDQWK